LDTKLQVIEIPDSWQWS